MYVDPPHPHLSLPYSIRLSRSGLQTCLQTLYRPGPLDISRHHSHITDADESTLWWDLPARSSGSPHPTDLSAARVCDTATCNGRPSQLYMTRPSLFPGGPCNARSGRPLPGCTRNVLPDIYQNLHPLTSPLRPLPGCTRNVLPDIYQNLHPLTSPSVLSRDVPGMCSPIYIKTCIR